MDRKGKVFTRFKEMCRKNDKDKIITSLIEIRKCVKWDKKIADIDEESFQFLINLIKMPNTKILDYSLSILANCCVNEHYRDLFKKYEGIPHLILVLKTIDNDNIACRASRLVGNLAIDSKLVKDLQEQNVGIMLVETLKKHNEMSSSSLLMTFRSIKKLWEIKDYRTKMLPENISEIICSCLDSTDDQVVRLTMETLNLFSSLNSSQNGILNLRSKIPNGAFKVTKELLLKLVELSKKDEFTSLAIICLSNLICHQKHDVWQNLEGSEIPEVFIEYFKNVDSIDNVIYKAFCQLCMEGAVRFKVKSAELLPRLMELCKGPNIPKILVIFYYFQYDKTSMTILAHHQLFVSLLIENISLPEALSLLSVISRLEPPIMELVEEYNLDVIINNKKCLGLLNKISRTQRYLQTLITSGKVWEICKAGCSMEEIGCSGYAEGLIVHLLTSGDNKCKENTSLAIPFLIKPRDFKLLYKLLAHYQAITTINYLLEKNPLEERVLASVIRLIGIFRENHSNNYNEDETSSFFTMGNDICTKEESEVPTANQPLHVIPKDEMITFELDNGSCASISKQLLCQNSPVLDAMLNGHFIESGQQKVKLSCCTRDALLHLAKILSNEMNVKDVPPETHLELISLTDRFLIFPLNDILTSNLIVNQSSCLAVYQWCRSAGHTKNNAIIRRKAYEFLFSSSDYLLQVMRNDSCRGPLIKEISNYLSNSLKDLL